MRGVQVSTVGALLCLLRELAAHGARQDAGAEAGVCDVCLDPLTLGHCHVGLEQTDRKINLQVIALIE